MSDLLIVALVVGLRFLSPLLIPLYPLPGILIALVLDAVDQTLFQSFTSMPLDGYQSYDKALDVYYLAIAYISTLRNWGNHFAFRAARLLFYYRLAGVALFELTGWRVLLFIFPNTFEYFFIWYETVSLWRDPLRLTRATIASAAAAIWIVIKLPQEFWIHIAHLDLTDVLKTAVFGASPETTWGHLFRAIPGVFIGGVLAAAGFIALLAWLAARRLPGPRTRPFSAAPRLRAIATEQLIAARARWSARVIDRDLGEKLALVTLVVVIFAEALPNTRATTPQLVIAAAALIVLNTAISHWLARRRVGWRNALGHFLATFVANTTVIALLQLLPGRHDLDDPAVLFFILLLSLIVALADRYTQVHQARFHNNEWPEVSRPVGQ